jgi:hypothetical protein
MATKTDPRTEQEARRRELSGHEPRHGPLEPLPTWRNTRPRANQEPDREDLKRSRERFEALLGR